MTTEVPTRRRRVVVAVTYVLGTALLGLSLGAHPGIGMFYLLTVLLAIVWTAGAFASGPVWWGQWHRTRSGAAALGAAVGVGLGLLFIVGAFVVREIGPIARLITEVLDHAQHGNVAIVAVITVVNGVAEELYFRGALYSALIGHHPIVTSTVLYVIATLASGNLMLAFAGILLGAVCAYERRLTSGVLAPIITHMIWGAVMVLALPPIFGV